MNQDLARFLQGIQALNIPRMEDLPYWTTKPIQFVYESTATLALGSYTWADTPSALTPTRPILPNALYYFRNITLAGDLEELDFTTNIVTTPAFRIYLKSGANVMLIREPIEMVKFFEQFDYRLVWMSQQDLTDAILAGFIGSLVQGTGLIGKADITLKAIISAQEIIDENYIRLFKENYPESTPVIAL